MGILTKNGLTEVQNQKVYNLFPYSCHPNRSIFPYKDLSPTISLIQFVLSFLKMLRSNLFLTELTKCGECFLAYSISLIIPPSPGNDV